MHDWTSLPSSVCSGRGPVVGRVLIVEDEVIQGPSCLLSSTWPERGTL